ncbi:hypothetical protein THAOC_25835, partial [Thalassiosira oceanica]
MATMILPTRPFAVPNPYATHSHKQPNPIRAERRPTPKPTRPTPVQRRRMEANRVAALHRRRTLATPEPTRPTPVQSRRMEANRVAALHRRRTLVAQRRLASGNDPAPASLCLPNAFGPTGAASLIRDLKDEPGHQDGEARSGVAPRYVLVCAEESRGKGSEQGCRESAAVRVRADAGHGARRGPPPPLGGEDDAPGSTSTGPSKRCAPGARVLATKVDEAESTGRVWPLDAELTPAAWLSRGSCSSACLLMLASAGFNRNGRWRYSLLQDCRRSQGSAECRQLRSEHHGPPGLNGLALAASGTSGNLSPRCDGALPYPRVTTVAPASIASLRIAISLERKGLTADEVGEGAEGDGLDQAGLHGHGATCPYSMGTVPCPYRFTRNLKLETL